MITNRPPTVDVGDPPGVFALLSRELKPTPGRLGNALRLTVFGLLAVAIGEAFRLPDVLIFVYVGFIVSNTDAGATTTTSVAGGIALVAATALVLLVFMVSLSQPALRLPLMALLVFVTGVVTKGAKLGHALQIFGMWTVYNLPQGDQLIQGALEQTYISGNTTSNTLPNLMFMSPEESLVHTLLWTAFEMILSIVLLFLFNKAVGRDPALVLRASLADRLAAVARVCRGDPKAAPALAKMTRQGTAKLLKLHGSAKTWHRGSPNKGATERLIAEIDRLCLVVLAWHRVAPAAAGTTLAPAALTCGAAETSLRRNVPFAAGSDAAAPGEAGPDTHMDAALLPLSAELTGALSTIRQILSDPGEWEKNEAKGPDGKEAAAKKKDSEKSGGFLVPDAWSNPAYGRFGVKLTIAAMFVYFVERLTNWSGIGTCLITIFVVSFDTTGETIHKAVLRVSGCLIGGAIGIGTILLIMPSMTTLGDLLLVMAGPLFLASWIKNGSERSNYAGQQIAIAYFTCMLSGYGPSLDMEGPRDRIVGILLGDITVYVVFTTIWPVSIAGSVRKGLGQALDRLADLLASHGAADAPASLAQRYKLRQGFDTAIAGTQAIIVNDPYETSRIRPDRRDPDRDRRVIDAKSVASLQALVLPVSMIVAQSAPQAAHVAMPRAAQESVKAYQAAMTEWFHACSRWMQKGTGGRELLATLPEPPDLAHAGSESEAAVQIHARATWLGVLHQDVIAMIKEFGAEPSEIARIAGAEPASAAA